MNEDKQFQDAIEEAFSDITCSICGEDGAEKSYKANETLIYNQIMIGESFWICNFCYDKLKDKLINIINTTKQNYDNEKRKRNTTGDRRVSVQHSGAV